LNSVPEPVLGVETLITLDLSDNQIQDVPVVRLQWVCSLIRTSTLLHAATAPSGVGCLTPCCCLLTSPMSRFAPRPALYCTQGLVALLKLETLNLRNNDITSLDPQLGSAPALQAFFLEVRLSRLACWMNVAVVFTSAHLTPPDRVTA
jgi:Leucine-rich repeat (LRR) protein